MTLEIDLYKRNSGKWYTNRVHEIPEIDTWDTNTIENWLTQNYDTASYIIVYEVKQDNGINKRILI